MSQGPLVHSAHFTEVHPEEATELGTGDTGGSAGASDHRAFLASAPCCGQPVHLHATIWMVDIKWTGVLR